MNIAIQISHLFQIYQFLHKVFLPPKSIAKSFYTLLPTHPLITYASLKILVPAKGYTI